MYRTEFHKVRVTMPFYLEELPNESMLKVGINQAITLDLKILEIPPDMSVLIPMMIAERTDINTGYG